MKPKQTRRCQELNWRKMRREVQAELNNGNWLYFGADPDPVTRILLAVLRSTISRRKAK